MPENRFAASSRSDAPAVSRQPTQERSRRQQRGQCRRRDAVNGLRRRRVSGRQGPRGCCPRPRVRQHGRRYPFRRPGSPHRVDNVVGRRRPLRDGSASFTRWNGIARAIRSIFSTAGRGFAANSVAAARFAIRRIPRIPRADAARRSRGRRPDARNRVREAEFPLSRRYLLLTAPARGTILCAVRRNRECGPSLPDYGGAARGAEFGS